MDLSITGKSLDDLILESIDHTLFDLFGRRVREGIYDDLARNSKLAKDEIPSHLGQFSDRLERIFGRSSTTIARAIAKRLYAKFDFEFETVPNLDLEGYVGIVSSRITPELIENAKKRNLLQLGSNENDETETAPNQYNQCQGL